MSKTKNYKDGYEVIKVRGNASYTLNVYFDKQTAEILVNNLNELESQNVDDIKCTYEARLTKVY